MVRPPRPRARTPEPLVPRAPLWQSSARFRWISTGAAILTTALVLSVMGVWKREQAPHVRVAAAKYASGHSLAQHDLPSSRDSPAAPPAGQQGVAAASPSTAKATVVSASSSPAPAKAPATIVPVDKPMRSPPTTVELGDERRDLPRFGQEYRGQVPFIGAEVPLQDGTWRVVAAIRGNDLPNSRRLAVLARIESSRVTGLVVLLGQVGGTGAKSGYRKSGRCDERTAFLLEIRSNDDYGRQSCLIVNHVDTRQFRERADPPWLRSAISELDTLGAMLPELMFTIAYREANDRRALEYALMVDPARDGHATNEAAWSRSEWHRDAIDAHPAKRAYADRLARLGLEQWPEVVRVADAMNTSR